MLNENGVNENVVNALHDGGWRVSDKEQLIAEYGFTSDELADIIEGLQQIENTMGRVKK